MMNKTSERMFNAAKLKIKNTREKVIMSVAVGQIKSKFVQENRKRMNCLVRMHNMKSLNELDNDIEMA